MDPLDLRADPATPHAAEEVLGHLQAFADVGFWEYDLDTDELYLSTQVFEILGIDEPTVDAYLAVVHPDDVELLTQVHARARSQPGPYRVRHRTRDGERVLQVRVQSVAGPTGAPVRYLGVISDATAEWQLEQALEQSTSARLTGLLATGAVHDLKNVFAVLLGHAQLALAADGRGDRPDPESLRAIERAAGRGLELASQLLQVGRAGPLTARRVDVEELFRRIAATATTVLGRHRTVVVEAATDDVDLLVDGARLERAVVDLLLNARDALPPGAGRVVVSFHALRGDEVAALVESHGVPAGAYGVVEVRDDGAGIASEVLARVTDPFFTTKAGSGGSGVGLHTVARFAEAAGGVLAIESEVGIGTTVRLVLPTRPRAPRAARKRAASVRAVVHGHDQGRLAALADALEVVGVQAVASTSTATSTTILRTEPIDLLVTDETSGAEDATLVRVAGVTSTPVLGVAEVLDGARDLDGDGLDAVVEAVDRLLHRKPQRVRG